MCYNAQVTLTFVGGMSRNSRKICAGQGTCREGKLLELLNKKVRGENITSRNHRGLSNRSLYGIQCGVTTA